ncbi:MAG: hypothetical protein WBV73_21785 [Phormidium sp.]
MKNTELITLQSCLVAVVKLPASESAPLVDKSLIENPVTTVSRLRKLAQHKTFWAIYDDAYDEFTNRYHANLKNKVILPKSNTTSSASSINQEIDNDSLPVTGVIKLMERLAGVFESDPVPQLKEDYQQFQAKLPEAEPDKKDNVYDWAEQLCRIC